MNHLSTVVGTNGHLLHYNAMCSAIAAAYEVDEVKDIRDKALAIEVYAKQAKNTEAERQACEIRLRAERKCGELLRAMEKAKGSAQPGVGRRGADGMSSQGPRPLADLGISYDQSSRWQQLADVPEEEFQQALATGRPSTSGVIAAQAPPKDKVSDAALWLWGTLRDFERDGLLDMDPNELVEGMLVHMQATTHSLAPRVAAWLGRIKQ